MEEPRESLEDATEEPYAESVSEFCVPPCQTDPNIL